MTLFEGEHYQEARQAVINNSPVLRTLLAERLNTHQENQFLRLSIQKSFLPHMEKFKQTFGASWELALINPLTSTLEALGVLERKQDFDFAVRTFLFLGYDIGNSIDAELFMDGIAEKMSRLTPAKPNENYEAASKFMKGILNAGISLRDKLDPKPQISLTPIPTAFKDFLDGMDLSL